MAVYTRVEEDELEAFLTNYELGPVVSFKGIAEGVQNTNYILRTESSAYILTLYERSVAKDDLPFFLGLMKHLAEKGVACPTPVDGTDGTNLRMLNGRPAALVSFLDGVSVARPTPAHCAEVGRGIAEMHNAVTDFQLSRPNSLSHDGWRALAEQCLDQADNIEPGLAEKVERELAYLDEHWPDNLPRGVIHADLFPDNVFFVDDHLSGLIDFYFACNDVLAYDLAICMNAWCFEPDGAFNATKARRFTAAYQKVRPLSQAETSSLPILARGAALRFLLTRLYDWANQVEGALVSPKNPLEYARKLRFHQRVKGPGEYGLD